VSRDHGRSTPLALSRPEIGRVFFGSFYLFILLGWYPQLQVTYVDATRGSDLPIVLAIFAAGLGATFGAGWLADALLAAAASALGSVAGFGLGAALLGELAVETPFYASPHEPIALEAGLWAEVLPVLVGSTVGSFIGAVGSALARERFVGGSSRGVLLATIVLVVSLAVVLALCAVSIGLVVVRTTSGGPASSIDPFVIRVLILALSGVAAASAALLRSVDGRVIVVITAPRIALGLVLVAIPYLVAAVYRMFVTSPF